MRPMPTLQSLKYQNKSVSVKRNIKDVKKKKTQIEMKDLNISFDFVRLDIPTVAERA